MRVLIIYGGTSAEHDVSVKSCETILQGLNGTTHTATLLSIARDGRVDVAISDGNTSLASFKVQCAFDGIAAALTALASDSDVAFPVLHGPFGEDGRLQGLFENDDHRLGQRLQRDAAAFAAPLPPAGRMAPPAGRIKRMRQTCTN